MYETLPTFLASETSGPIYRGHRRFIGPIMAHLLLFPHIQGAAGPPPVRARNALAPEGRGDPCGRPGTGRSGSLALHRLTIPHRLGSGQPSRSPWGGAAGPPPVRATNA